jgi:vanillate monooxygenase ferredoxin subunit
MMQVVVKSRKEEADGIIALELVAAEGCTLPQFEAGAHVALFLESGRIRHYSLCNSPLERGRYLIGVQLDPKSRGGSAEVFQNLKVGKRITIGHPKNNFPLRPGAKRAVLMAGGIGITPLLAIAYQLQHDQIEFDLHYCARDPCRVAFSSALREPPLARRVTFHFDDGPVSQQLHLKKALGAPDDKTHLYVCGPAGFISFVVEGAKALGWQRPNIHVESFSAEVDQTGETFFVRAMRSGITCSVPSGMTIAEALLRAGVEVPLSCEEGVCGTCLTPVLEGIPEHRDMVQTDEEKTSNRQIALCCSRSRTPLLIVDL